MTNQKNLTIGLLPLFLNLYVDVCSKEDVERITSFADVICDEYKQRSINVVLSDICCVAEDFESAIQTFKKAGVDAIVTLHLAYSPSLESIAAIAARRAIDNAKIDPETIDQIIVAQNFGDVRSGSIQTDIVPSIASRVKNALQITRLFVY